MNFIPNRRPVLITGASGFIGAHLARRLCRTGEVVVGTCTALHRAGRVRDMPPNFILAVADPSSLNRFLLGECMMAAARQAKWFPLTRPVRWRLGNWRCAMA